jgi:hypothetical protein
MPRLGWLAAVCLMSLPQAASAATVVLANRTAAVVEFSLQGASATARSYKLPAAELVAVRVEGTATVSFNTKEGPRAYQIEPNSAHFFHRGSGSLELESIGFGEIDGENVPAATTVDNTKTQSPADTPAVPKEPLKISVKLLVDEEERATRPRWEERLRKRLQTASDIIRQHCGLTFHLVGVQTWESDNQAGEFEQSLREFEREVAAAPARLAIGFTSQYQLQEGRVHMGGTHGPLGTHILLREWSQHVSEPERLELLLHELGHFLGASHSPEGDSVMRPTLADRKALSRSFRIGFDPVNALVMNLVAEGMQTTEVRSLRQLPAENRRLLQRIYATLVHAQPEDPASPVFLALVSDRPAVRLPPPALADPRPSSFTLNPTALLPRLENLLPLVDATRSVLAEIVGAAGENSRRPVGRQAAGEELFRRADDSLMEHYVRRAATAAQRQNETVRNQAFFLALAVAVDTTNLLRDHPFTAEMLKRLETDAERDARLVVIGQPTLRGRHDLAQHYFVSAAIAALAGSALAESAGLAKELNDSAGGSGFSFADLAADLAGITLAEQVQSGRIPLARLQRSFPVEKYLPSLSGLPDDLSQAQFAQTYGGAGDPRYQAMLRDIRQRIEGLFTLADR